MGDSSSGWIMHDRQVKGQRADRKKNQIGAPTGLRKKTLWNIPVSAKKIGRCFCKLIMGSV